jgi:long-chain-fatty-acid---luciferin-component ligase
MTVDAASAFKYEKLDAVTPLDRVIFGSADPFALAQRDEETIRLAVVRDAVDFHAARDPSYRRWLTSAAVGVDELQSVKDLDRVPQLPTAIFKRRNSPLVHSAEARPSRSSGTLGTVSAVWRDHTTTQRLLGSVKAGLRLIDSWYEDEVHVVNLGPDRQEAAGLWFAYVMSLLEIVFPTTHCVKADVFDKTATLQKLSNALGAAPSVGVVGPPMLVADLAATALRTRWSCDADRITVVTAGGWKRAVGEALARDEFDDLVCRAFGVSDPYRDVRDAFNQVELNTVLFECRARRKHVPPWVHVTVRDPVALLPVAPESYGLLSYLDASASSYPCFIVGDDIGMLRDGACPCGRIGRTVEILRRVRRDESWGCALKMDSDVVR